MLTRRRFIHQLSGGAAVLAGSSMFPSSRVLGANDRIRFGLIGAGGRGMDIFRAALHAPDTEAVAVADVYSRRLDEVKSMVPAIHTYTDFRRLLDDKSIDAVLIATPQHQHALNFVPSIQAGKDVYQEKTMAFNPDHARRMRRALEGSNRVVQVGVQSVSGKAFVRVHEFSTPDRLGTITAVHTHHYRNMPYGGWKRTIPPDCNLQHVAWKEFEGEAAPHEFDAQRFINWRFFWDYSGGNDLVLGNKGTVIRIVNSVNYLPQNHHAAQQLHTNSGVGGEPNIIGSDEDDTEAHLRNFFDCVRSREEPNCPFELGFRSAIACQMAIASLRQGRTVEWDPEKEDIV